MQNSGFVSRDPIEPAILFSCVSRYADIGVPLKTSGSVCDIICANAQN